MGYDALPLTKLVEQFASLPGIGRKTAGRLAFFVLKMSEEDAKAFSDAILEAHEKIHNCEICQNYTDMPVCNICSDTQRDRSTICVVEDAKDVLAFERTREYKGLYHVLHGLISPMDGIGPGAVICKRIACKDCRRRSQRGYYGNKSDCRGRNDGDVYFSLIKTDGD